MTVPTYDHFIEPLFRYLAAHADGASIADVSEALAGEMGLTPDDRAALLPSGTQAVFKNRIGWAHDRLKRSGLSASPRRGFWKLTPEGATFASKDRTISKDDVERLAIVNRSLRLKPPKDAPSDASLTVEPATPPPERSSPEERIEAALAEGRESVARDLLEKIGRSPPEFFEKVVLDLLPPMGSGTSRSDLQRVGGSGDGGIDGIISLDRLGLEKVYVQAKRWQGTVGRPALQGFFGALKGRRANKGVFITTSSFTRDAVEFAEQVSDSIVLVEDARLSGLMIEHFAGVNHRALRIAQVDGDYFDEV